jgi:hypothetical protein
MPVGRPIVIADIVSLFGDVCTALGRRGCNTDESRQRNAWLEAARTRAGG